MNNPDFPTREAALVLPIQDNEGASLQSAHESLREALLAAFGGFTISLVTGQWRDDATGRVYTDDSLQYSIAAQWSDGRQEKLREVAQWIRNLARQETVYVRHGNGDVEFISGRSEPAPFQVVSATRH